MLSELEKKIEEVKLNYKDLPKAKSDEGEFVIIAEKDDGGSYSEYKECLGIQEDGQLIWSFLSGCSCRGGNEQIDITDITAKIFSIKETETVEEFYNNYKIDPYETSYTSY